MKDRIHFIKQRKPSLNRVIIKKTSSDSEKIEKELIDVLSVTLIKLARYDKGE